MLAFYAGVKPHVLLLSQAINFPCEVRQTAPKPGILAPIEPDAVLTVGRSSAFDNRDILLAEYDMKLYHFTVIENLFLISMRGLKPRIHRAGTSEDAAHMTMGQPVVWLTRQKSNLATDTDIARLRMQGVLDCKVGDFMFGGDQRLTVNIERHNNQLMRYADFLRTTDIVVADPDNSETFWTGRDVLNSGTLPQSALNDWWVYFGTIAPHKMGANRRARAPGH